MFPLQGNAQCRVYSAFQVKVSNSTFYISAAESIDSHISTFQFYISWNRCCWAAVFESHANHFVTLFKNHLQINYFKVATKVNWYYCLQTIFGTAWKCATVSVTVNKRRKWFQFVAVDTWWSRSLLIWKLLRR